MHSLYSPSSSSRWLSCPASVHLTDQDKAVLAQRDTTAADRGTLGHHMVEYYLIWGCHDDDALEQADESLIQDVEYCIEWVLKNTPDTRQLETRIQSSLIEDFGGTIDILVIDGDTVRVVDFKFGRQKVAAEDNPQMLCYLMLAREVYPDYKKYRADILQPMYNKQPPLEVSDDYLDEFFLRVLDATLDNYYEAGPHCKYCPLLYRCETAAKAVWDAVDQAPTDDEITDGAPSKDLMARAVNAFKAYKLAEGAVKNLSPVIKDWVGRGYMAPADFGLKVYRTKREYWNDQAESTMANELGDQAYEKSLVTPAKARKLLGLQKEEMAEKFSGCLEVKNITNLKVAKDDYCSDFEDLTR